MGKLYVILGGGCSTAVQTALYLLEQTDTERVISIGRAPLRHEAFTFNLDKNPKFNYYAYHLTYEFDLVLDLIDAIKPDIIINFVAQGETSVSWQHTWRFFETNCVTLSKLCEELEKRTWIERFLHVSTAGVYGYADFAVAEDHSLDPSSPYGASKAGFDMYIKSMQKITKLPINILRPSNIYCPGQMLHKLLPRAAMCGLKGDKLPLHGGGVLVKSYLHARDFAKAIYLVIKHAPAGKFYNVAPDVPKPLFEIVTLVAKELNLDLDDLCNITQDRLFQDGGYWMDCNSIKNDVDWAPEISIEVGVKQVVDWVKKYFDYLSNQSTTYILRG